MRISDWSSDVCSSELGVRGWEESGRAGIPISWRPAPSGGGLHPIEIIAIPTQPGADVLHYDAVNHSYDYWGGPWDDLIRGNYAKVTLAIGATSGWTIFLVADRSEEHTSELQSLMRI